jgi:hypothetical protein
MSEARSTQPSQGPAAKKARNPVERIFVYGVIIALVVLVGFEAYGMFAHTRVVNTLTAQMETTETDAKAPDVTEADIKAALGSKQPIRTEEYPSAAGYAKSKKLEVYSWFSLRSWFDPTKKRELWVKYAKKGAKDDAPQTVISISTDSEEARSPEVVAPAAGGQGPGGEGGPTGMMPPPGGGGPGGPPGGLGDPNAPSGLGRRGRSGAESADGDKADANKSDDEKTPDSETDKPEGKSESGQ